jgi:hypothetical protein
VSNLAHQINDQQSDHHITSTRPTGTTQNSLQIITEMALALAAAAAAGNNKKRLETLVRVSSTNIYLQLDMRTSRHRERAKRV